MRVDFFGFAFIFVKTDGEYYLFGTKILKVFATLRAVEKKILSKNLELKI